MASVPQASPFADLPDIPVLQPITVRPDASPLERIFAEFAAEARAGRLPGVCPDCGRSFVRNETGAEYCAECDRRNLVARCTDNGWDEHDDYPGADADYEELDYFVLRRERECRDAEPLHPEDEAIERARVNAHPGSEWL